MQYETKEFNVYALVAYTWRSHEVSKFVCYLDVIIGSCKFDKNEEIGPLSEVLDNVLIWI